MIFFVNNLEKLQGKKQFPDTEVMASVWTMENQGLKFDVLSWVRARTAHAKFILRAQPLMHAEKSRSIW